MNDQLWWYATRAAGLMTWTTAVASVIVGLLLSTRAVKSRTGPWMLDLHRFLGGVSVLFLAVHLVTLWLDSFVDFGPRELFIPGESSWNTEAAAWGIIAAYALVLVELTSLLRKWISATVWRTFHMLSIVTVAAGSYHAFLGGSDVDNPLTWVIAGAGSAIVITLVALRLKRSDGAGSPRIARANDREALLQEMRDRLETLPIPEQTAQPELTTDGGALPRRAPIAVSTDNDAAPAATSAGGGVGTLHDLMTAPTIAGVDTAAPFPAPATDPFPSGPDPFPARPMAAPTATPDPFVAPPPPPGDRAPHDPFAAAASAPAPTDLPPADPFSVAPNDHGAATRPAPAPHDPFASPTPAPADPFAAPTSEPAPADPFLPAFDIGQPTLDPFGRGHAPPAETPAPAEPAPADPFGQPSAPSPLDTGAIPTAEPPAAPAPPPATESSLPTDPAAFFEPEPPAPPPPADPSFSAAETPAPAEPPAVDPVATFGTEPAPTPTAPSERPLAPPGSPAPAAADPGLFSPATPSEAAATDPAPVVPHISEPTAVSRQPAPRPSTHPPAAAARPPGPPPLPVDAVDPETGEPDEAAYSAWLVEWLAYAEKYGEEAPGDPSRIL